MNRFALGTQLLAFGFALFSTTEGHAQRRHRHDPNRLISLVRRSDQAESRLSYTGTKVVRRHRPGGGEAKESTVRVWHRAPDETRIDFVENGPPGGAIVQLGDRHFFRTPSGDFRRVPHVLPTTRVDLMLQNYNVKRLKFEKIANRPAIAVSIDPKHSGNPRKVTWLDVHTALPLKTEVYRSDGQLSEVSEFRQIGYNPEFAPGLFSVPNDAMMNQPPPEPAPNFEAVRPSWVPPGYQLVRTSSFNSPARIVAVHLRYTDGLNTLSLFQARGGSPFPPRRDGRGGPGPQITGKVGDIHYVLVGDIARDQLQKMAESLK